MTESHYNKAQNLFIHLDSHMELMRVLLERVALYEFEFNGKFNPFIFIHYKT